MNYWLDLFTGETWDAFRKAGSKISGFRPRMKKNASKVEPGDILLCYLTGVKRWVGALKVIGPTDDDSPIWTYDFPVRFQVQSIVELDPEFGVPLDEFEGKLCFYRGPQDRGKYKGFLRMSPNRFSSFDDGNLILELLKKAEQAPVKREVDPKLLAKKPVFKAEIRSGSKRVETNVMIPDIDEEEDDISTVQSHQIDIRRTLQHTEIQYHLLNLGVEMGLDVWVARNDRNREWNSIRLGSLSGIVDELPTQFNEATTKTIELIDVLWLKGNSIIAAFEVECTTSIYSGLLRMSDLLTLQPNLDIPIFIVAPDDRRNKVEQEILRPTFKLKEKPLNTICGFLSFSNLMSKVQGIRELGLASSLNPNFLRKTAEYFSDLDA